MRAGRRWYLLAGLVLLVVVNAVVMMSVYFNRQPPASSVLELSERELGVAFGRYGYEANHAVSLWLSYRWPTQEGDETYITANKMLGLGFDISPELADCRLIRAEKRSPRDAFLVLEVNGPAYQRELELTDKAYALAVKKSKERPRDQERKNALKAAEEALKYERQQASRALVVDVGLDAEVLRDRYGDRKQHAIVAVQVQPKIKEMSLQRADQEHGCVHYATASRALGRIHVPLELRDVFVRQTSLEHYGQYGRGASVKPFSVELALGKRYEPWLVSARQIEL
jgi:hypothetical protein